MSAKDADAAVAAYALVVKHCDAEAFVDLLDAACRCAAAHLGHEATTKLMTQAASLQLARQMAFEATRLAEGGETMQ